MKKFLKIGGIALGAGLAITAVTQAIILGLAVKELNRDFDWDNGEVFN